MRQPTSGNAGSPMSNAWHPACTSHNYGSGRITLQTLSYCISDRGAHAVSRCRLHTVLSTTGHNS
eukprot:5919953-Prymnesium_polylepis.1